MDEDGAMAARDDIKLVEAHPSIVFNRPRLLLR